MLIKMLRKLVRKDTDKPELEKLRQLMMYREYYDVATALRGPDFEADGLKYVFTERIRWYTGAIGWAFARSSPHIYQETISKVIDEIKQTDKSELAHYIRHVIAALEALKEMVDNYELSDLSDLENIARKINDYIDGLADEETVAKSLARIVKLF